MGLLAQGNLSYPDAGMWNTLSFDYGLSKHWSIIGAEEVRIKENYSRLNLLYTNIGLEYVMNKYFKTSLVYRNIEKYNNDNTFIIRHRLMWDATLKYRFNRVGFAYRHRLQKEYRALLSSETGSLPEWYSRNKFSVEYQVNKQWDSYAAIELRYQIHDPRNVESEHTWHRARYQFGVDYRLNKFSKVGAYYLIQRVWNVPNRENLFITGLEYSISLAEIPFLNRK